MKKILICSSEEKKKEVSGLINCLSLNYSLVSKGYKPLKDNYVIIIGGDGSLNYFLNNIWKKEKTWNIIYIPKGTANDFSRNFKYRINPNSLQLEDIESIFKSNSYIKIPIMKCNSKYFINAASIGSPANVTEEGSDNFLKNLTGPFSYYINSLKELVDYSPINIEYFINKNNEKLETCGLIISQGLYVGGGIKVSKFNSPNFSDNLRITISKRVKPIDVIGDLIQYQKENLKEIETENIEEIESSKIIIKSDNKIPVKLDGEYCEDKELIFKKTKHKINFFIY